MTVTEEVNEGGGEEYRLVYEAVPEGTLIQRPLLGVQGMPYILIEPSAGDDGVLEFTTTSGGGLDDPGKVGEILEMIAESLVGKTRDDLTFVDSEGDEEGDGQPVSVPE